MAELGYPTTPEALTKRIAAMAQYPGDGTLVAEVEGRIVGLVAFHSFPMLHRPGRLGRITALVVSAAVRGRGVGSQLLSAAESHLCANGCARLEVTSGEQRSDAHRFYVARGYHEQRVRFVKDPATERPRDP